MIKVVLDIEWELIKDVQGNPVFVPMGMQQVSMFRSRNWKAGVNMTVDTENTPIDQKSFYMSIG